MLIWLCKDYNFEYMVVVFDVKGKIFCDDMYVEYKVNCLFMFDDLCSQIKLLYDVICKMGLLLLIVDGVEVDDVIGILCEQVIW